MPFWVEEEQNESHTSILRNGKHPRQESSEDPVHNTHGVLKTTATWRPRKDPRGGPKRVKFAIPDSSESRPSSSQENRVFPPTPYLETKDSSSSSGSPPPANTTTSSSSTPSDSWSTQSTSDVSGAANDTRKYKVPSSTSSSSLPSMGSISPRLPPPATEEKSEYTSWRTSSMGDEEYAVPQISPQSMESEEAFRERAAAEVTREVVLSIQAYLGHRHDDISAHLAASPDPRPVKNKHAGHQAISQLAHLNSSRSVKRTSVLHWAGVCKAKQRERTAQRRNSLTALLQEPKNQQWGQASNMPPPVDSMGMGMGMRPGLFAPLSPPGQHSNQDLRAYREATLANLARLQPRLDLTLEAFAFNMDALRLYGGLVGDEPRERDLARMDRLLRELEGYIEVCERRCDVIVGTMQRTLQVPITLPAQLGDLEAAHAIADEDRLAATRRCFEYLADRSSYVMTYEGKRRKRQFAGQLGHTDVEKLKLLSETDEEAGRHLSQLIRADDWRNWCRDTMSRWTLGWRPETDERRMIYVDEAAEEDVRRYKREINDKRAALGLGPVERPHDGVYERQLEQMRLYEELYKLMT
ncbi:hypothetical protein diail_2774 [Diaporthe ilicicola]|nr:hypothetical protein diail_2774 [Diaporthe ilicicola]